MKCYTVHINDFSEYQPITIDVPYGEKFGIMFIGPKSDYVCTIPPNEQGLIPMDGSEISIEQYGTMMMFYLTSAKEFCTNLNQQYRENVPGFPVPISKNFKVKVKGIVINPCISNPNDKNNIVCIQEVDNPQQIVQQINLSTGYTHLNSQELIVSNKLQIHNTELTEQKLQALLALLPSENVAG